MDIKDFNTDVDSICVSGLPDKVTDEILTIHFQKRRNNGGDVKEVNILSKGKAVITFEDPKTVEGVLQCKQILANTELSVQPYVADMGFENEMTVESELLQKYADFKEQTFSFCIRKLAKTYNILFTIGKTSNKWLVTGKWNDFKKFKLFFFKSINEIPTESVSNTFSSSQTTSLDVSEDYWSSLQNRHSKQLLQILIRTFLQVDSNNYMLHITSRKGNISEFKHELNTIQLDKVDLSQDSSNDAIISKQNRNSALFNHSNFFADENDYKEERIYSEKGKFSYYEKQDYSHYDKKKEKLSDYEEQNLYSYQKKNSIDEHQAHSDYSDTHLSLPNTLSYQKSSYSINEFKDEFIFNAVVKVHIYFGDITKEHVDAIVNSANSELYPGGGVSKAIFNASKGSSIYDACKNYIEKNGKVQPGNVVVTPAGLQFCKNIIHVVADYHDNDTNCKKLKKLMEKCLKEIEKHGWSTIALPLIGSGNLGYSKVDAAKAMIHAIISFSKSKKPLTIILIDNDANTVSIILNTLNDEMKKNNKCIQKNDTVIKNMKTDINQKHFKLDSKQYHDLSSSYEDLGEDLALHHNELNMHQNTTKRNLISQPFSPREEETFSQIKWHRNPQVSNFKQVTADLNKRQSFSSYEEETSSENKWHKNPQISNFQQTTPDLNERQPFFSYKEETFSENNPYRNNRTSDFKKASHVPDVNKIFGMD